MNHIDPMKESKALALRLKNNVTTLAHEFALQGKDWESELRQISREKKLMQELGLTDSDIKI
jgi:capsid protein